MDKIRSLKDKIASSAPTSTKLSKAFRFDKQQHILDKAAGKRTRDPFTDGPELEEVGLVFLLLCPALQMSEVRNEG